MADLETRLRGEAGPAEEEKRGDSLRAVVEQALTLLPGVTWDVAFVGEKTARFFTRDVEFRFVFIRGGRWMLDALVRVPVQAPVRPSAEILVPGRPDASELASGICGLARELHARATQFDAGGELGERLRLLCEKLEARNE